MQTIKSKRFGRKNGIRHASSWLSGRLAGSEHAISMALKQTAKFTRASGKLHSLDVSFLGLRLVDLPGADKFTGNEAKVDWNQSDFLFMPVRPRL